MTIETVGFIVVVKAGHVFGVGKMDTAAVGIRPLIRPLMATVGMLNWHQLQNICKALELVTIFVPYLQQQLQVKFKLIFI